MATDILTVTNLTIERKEPTKKIISPLSFTVPYSNYIGVFGPSGSGKTTLLTTIMRICPPAFLATGDIVFQSKKGEKIILQQGQLVNNYINISREVAYIPQHAAEAFDPIEKMGRQFEETLTENQLAKRDHSNFIQILLEKMNLPRDILTKYPFQLSGGTLQRCAIGLAIILNPTLIIADEPTSALDSINKKRIADCFFERKQKEQTSLLLATHDIALIDYLCDEVLVLMNGEKMEQREGVYTERQEQSYLSVIRDTKKKLSAPFWRLKYGEMA